MHHGTSVKLPSCSQFIDFIRNQSHILQRANNIVGTRQSSYKSVKNSTSFSTSRPNSNNYNKISKTFVIKDQNKCYCCGNTEHFQLRFCKKFNALSPTERFDFIKLNKGCVNCLSKEHTVRHCTSKSTCTQCSRSHHSLLHFTSELNREPHSKILSERITNASFATNVSSSQAAHATAASPQSISLCAINPSADVPRAQSPGHTILLGTAQCNVIDCAGNKNTVRILVDSASQRDLITLNCCKKLNLQLLPSPTKYVYGRERSGSMRSARSNYLCLVSPSFIIIELGKKEWPLKENVYKIKREIRDPARGGRIAAALNQIIIEYSDRKGNALCKNKEIVEI
ncbi:uncharacterized protein LOC126977141 [Leptidea sinapis]|uniref:uncharacterized protein LOC126977141 n=1 Tax=Leptidea sinapis TaxID=189913 RepID=UPI0021C3BA48|nr:uncharacterized protein LOC126977141 [Leptidea sinapis]